MKKNRIFVASNHNKREMAKRVESAVLVEFNDGRKFLFGSIAAIFDMFTYEEVGARKEAIWAMKLEFDKPLVLGKCIITKMQKISKEQANARKN